VRVKEGWKRNLRMMARHCDCFEELLGAVYGIVVVCTARLESCEVCDGRLLELSFGCT
jgi:hypothetical protein